MPAAASPEPLVYSERLHLGVGWWIGTLVMALLLGLELAPLFGSGFWLVVLIAVALAAALLAAGSLNRVEVADGAIRTRKWQISCVDVASVEELDQRNTRRFAGVAGDPSALVLVRPWVKRSVRVICVTDDPPFALISTRHPEKLSAAIVACASMAADQD